MRNPLSSLSTNTRLILVFILLFLLIWIAAKAAGPGATRNSVTLAWDYPTNELSTNLLFKVYSHTNITVPLTNWTVLTNVVGTNLNVAIPMNAQQRFFYVTASNYWGESFPSNVAGTPPPPRDQVGLRLE